MMKINEKMMIAVVPFWMDLSASIFYLAAPLVVIDLGGNPIELGLIGTITASVPMVLANLAGRLSDRLGRRMLMVLGPLLFVISCLLMTQMGNIKGILALAALNGLGMAIFWPAFQAWIAESRNGSGLARNIGSFNMSWTASHLVGPTLAGFLFTVHMRLPFWLAASLCLFLFLAMRVSVSERNPLPPKEMESPGLETEGSKQGRTFLYAIWIANFASFFILANARYQFPKLAREMEISPYTIGLLMSCIGLAQFSGFFLLRGSGRWHFSKLHLFGAQGLAAAGLALLFAATAPWVFAFAFLMLGLCASLTYYSSLYYAVRLLKRKGKGAGLHESILGGGVVLGPLLGGITAHTAGLRAPYILCLILLVVVVTAEWFILRTKSER
jgi:DHA1 family multidrug resistance protein-like MFS transporter